VCLNLPIPSETKRRYKPITPFFLNFFMNDIGNMIFLFPHLTIFDKTKHKKQLNTEYFIGAFYIQ